MLSISGFMIELFIVLGVALAALALIAGVWGYQFFSVNHRVRIAHREPLVPYYRNLAFGH